MVLFSYEFRVHTKFYKENFVRQVMVKVNKEDCIACGNCSSVCSDVFEMQDDGKAGVKAGKEGATDECVDKAIAECPAHCISK